MEKMSERLIKRLKADGFSIPKEAVFRRLYPGHWQRSAGAWVWTITAHGCDIGSCDTVYDCLRATQLAPIGGGEIVAEFCKTNPTKLTKAGAK